MCCRPPQEIVLYCNEADAFGAAALDVAVLHAQAETSGTVSAMLVDNGTTVTPGQPLLVIKS